MLTLLHLQAEYVRMLGVGSVWFHKRKKVVHLVQVYYRVVEGLTFEMCQKGLDALTQEARDNFGKVMRELEDLNVSVITGDCVHLPLH